MRRGFDFTQIGNKEMIMTKGTNERMGGRPQAQDNKSKQDNQWKLIQAKKALEMRDRVLTAAIRRCHVELAKKESFWDIEASKDAVEAAWKEFNHANSRYCVYAGWDMFLDCLTYKQVGFWFIHPLSLDQHHLTLGCADST